MEIIYVLQENKELFLFFIFFFSLLIGSFLNVVIYRLPLIMQQSWQQECAELLNQSTTTDTEKLTLSFPASQCPSCSHKIRAWENIPVMSFLFLKGKCSSCKAAISIRYPIIELSTALLSVVIANHFGVTLETVSALILTYALIALSMIDFDHQLLPDDITLPLLWIGLFLNIFGIFTDLQSSVIGAISGYLALWSVFWLFKLLTGKEGMGYGDFKLLAVFGGWLGWQFLPQIILLSSLVGAIIGIALIITLGRDKNIPIPFGPYLAIAGWISLLYGEEINQSYLQLAGIS